MQVISRLLLLLAFLTPLTSNAADCQAVKWPYSSSVQNIHVQNLRLVRREYLSFYLYYELSNPIEKRTKGLAEKLLKYLLSSELDESKYYFYAALGESADLQTGAPKVIQLQQICELQNKLVRNPTSVRLMKKKSKKI